VKTGTPQLTSEEIEARRNRKLSEVAKRLAVPSGITGSYWPRVRATAGERLGLTLDRWQDGAAGLMLAHRADGVIAHTVGGFGLCICRQVGKCLDVETPLLTTGGWSTMANIQVGDQVFHPSGRAVAVTEVHPVHYNHDCYEVTTTDGRTVVADAEHLWAVYDRKQRRDRVMTTVEILDAGLDRYGSTRQVVTDGRAYQTREYRFGLPRQECIEGLPEADLPIDPYLLGAWLGNGAASGAQLTCGDQDVEHWLAEVESAGFTPSARLDTHGGSTRWCINIPGGLRTALRELGVLNDKHIPEQYLTSSADQRLALLQGLLDTDGTIEKRGIVEFTSMTKDLADGVLFLARSLGWRAVLREGKAKLNGRDYGTKYRVGFTPKLVDGRNPFRLPRKAEKVGAADGGKGRFAVSIASIERVATRPVRCIKVDSEDGLFLAGRDLIATHNTHTVTCVLFGLCVEFPGLLAIWTSHHVKTNSETFLAVQSYCKRERIKPFIRNVYTGSGDEAVVFTNGSRILFGARERGFGRGIPGVDVLVNDEGQIMTQRAMQDMLATMNTSRLGLHVYVGTPPKPTDNSEVFRVLRQEAATGEATDLAWVEIGADDDIADLDDPEQWLKANPSAPHRTPLVSIQRLRRRLDDDGFRREALGLWDAEETSAFDIDAWAKLADRGADTPQRAALVIDMSPDRRHCWIGAAGAIDTDEGEKVLLMATETTAAEAVSRVRSLIESRDIVEVAITGGAARALEPDLVEASIEYKKLGPSDIGASYVCLQEAIKNKTICHVNQDELNMAMLMTKTRFITSGEVEVFDRRNYSVNLSPAVACACALYRWGMVAAPMPVLL